MVASRCSDAAAVFLIAAASCLVGCTSLDRLPGASGDGGAVIDIDAGGAAGDAGLDARVAADALGIDASGRDAMLADTGPQPDVAGCPSVMRTSVPFDVLAPFGCPGPGQPVAVCMQAVASYCRATVPCAVSGVGVLSESATAAEIACVGPGYPDNPITFAELSDAVGMTIDASNVRLRAGQSAVHQWCVSRGMGYVVGVGPVRVDTLGETVLAHCIGPGVGAPRSVKGRSLVLMGCDYPRSIDTTACSAAADQYCTTIGYVAGLGPVIYAGLPTVLCLGH